MSNIINNNTNVLSNNGSTHVKVHDVAFNKVNSSTITKKILDPRDQKNVGGTVQVILPRPAKLNYAQIQKEAEAKPLAELKKFGKMLGILSITVFILSSITMSINNTKKVQTRGQIASGVSEKIK